MALLWGGDWSRRRHDRELENWTTATDVNLILERLNIEILKA